MGNTVTVDLGGTARFTVKGEVLTSKNMNDYNDSASLPS
jgi:hypothetical protein